MSLINDKVEAFMTKWFGPDWKSTLAGFCSFIIANSTMISAYLMSQASLHPGASWFWPKASIVFTAIVGAARFYIGKVTKDSGKALAILPGSSKVVNLPSHEIPDDPSAIPVAESTEPVTPTIK